MAKLSKDDKLLKKGIIRCCGIVVKILPDTMFRVKLDNEGDKNNPAEEKIILGKACGNMKKSRIKVALGDTVDMEVSVYDKTKARIVSRRRPNQSK